MTDINDITREMGSPRTRGTSSRPLQPHRRPSRSPKRQYENLHKWFPIVVRYPWLLPIARPAIKLKFMNRVYLRCTCSTASGS